MIKIENTEVHIVREDIPEGRADILSGKIKDENSLRQAIAAAFISALEENFSSIAFSAPEYGAGELPSGTTAKILAQEILRICRYQQTSLKEIVICLSDEESFRIFDQTITGYVNHVINDLGKGPYVTVDAIIELPKGIVIIERSNPPFGWALPGGFVDVGESLEEAVVREVKEETHLDFVDIRQFRTYSDPCRDPRFHTVATVYIGKGKGEPQFGDDAKGLKIVSYEDLLKGDYAFDHKQVIEEYLNENH